MTAPIRSQPSPLRSALVSLARQSLPVDEPEALGEIIATVHWYDGNGGLEANAGKLKEELAEIKERCRARHDPEEIKKRELALLSSLLRKYSRDPWLQQVLLSFLNTVGEINDSPD